MAPRKNYDASGSEGQGEGRSRSNSGGKRQGAPKESEDYRKRRERNNIAVRKSRQLSRQKAKVTQEKVSQLRQENKELEQKVQLLTKELSVLRDLFMSTAAVTSQSDSGATAPPQVFEETEESKASVQTDHKYAM